MNGSIHARRGVDKQQMLGLARNARAARDVFGGGRPTLLLALLVSLGFSLTACDDKSGGAPVASASVTATASAEPPPKPVPWHQGDWAGEYDASHYVIEMEGKDGAIRNWKDDDGKVGSGKGKIALSIDEAGEVSGTLTGPFGSMDATGSFEDNVLSVRLTPTDEEAVVTSAYFLADKKGDAFEGKLQASSGDSLKVRDARLRLIKGRSGAGALPAAPAPAPSASAEPSAAPSSEAAPGSAPAAPATAAAPAPAPAPSGTP